MAWTIRYRFGVSTPLNSDAKELSLVIGGREAVVSGEGRGPLGESNWLTLNIHDLENEHIAREVGRRVILAVLLAGTRRGVGIDVGENRATLSFGSVVVNKIAELGRKLLPNVHGLFIYEREGNEVFMQMNAVGKVTIDPAPFLSEIAASFDETVGLGEREETALTLIALSKAAREPLAAAVLCISAVEFLSTDAPWSPAQLELLDKLQAQASGSTELHREEAKEVAGALGRVFRTSIRQSIKRKMTALGFTETDWRSFDEVYNLRSGIFHGSTTGRDRHHELECKAREICARIVLVAAQRTQPKNGTH
jgi:hypothetical protein